MSSSVRLSPDHAGRRAAGGAALAIALALGLQGSATAAAMDECAIVPAERSVCLEAMEVAVAEKLEATLQTAIDLYAGLDAITGNQRASRTLAQGQAAFELYRDLDCHLVELQVGAGTNSADDNRACRIDHNRQRIATLAARLPEPPAELAAPADQTEGDTADSELAETNTSDASVIDDDTTGDAATAAMILNSAWRVTEIAGEPVADGVEPTLAIDADGGISGSGGCNRYFGNATIDGEQISMGGIGATRMACPEPAMGEEQRYLKALDAVASWQLEADQLALADDTGTVLVRLERDAR